ncbi:MAG: hypothetical protein AAGI48_13785 [Verrucomicrobiota bacterium]
MNLRLRSPFFLLLGLSLFSWPALAQEAPSVQVRYSCFDPLKGDHELYLMDAKTGDLEPILLSSRSLSRVPISVKTVNGKVLFLREDDLEKEKLLQPGNIAFSVAVPNGVTRAAIVIIVSGERIWPVLIDDSPGKFPYGSSLIINATNVNVGVQAGEHRKGAQPGELALIPAVTQLNEYNQARVDFVCQLSKDEPELMSISKKKLPFNDKRRRIWIAYMSKGAKKPAIATIVDSIR